MDPIPLPPQQQQGAAGQAKPQNGAANDRNDNTGKIFIGGLNPSSTNDSLKAFFSQNYGPVLDAKIMTMQDKGSGQIRSRGFGFLKFEDPNVCDVVLNGQTNIKLMVDGKEVDIKRIDENKTNATQLQNGGIPPVDPHRAELESRKIFVGGLPDSVTNEKLSEYFRTIDPNIIDARVMVDAASGRNRGFGYITFSSKDAVAKAIELKANHMIDGKWVEVKQSVARGQVGNKGPSNNHYNQQQQGGYQNHYGQPQPYNAYGKGAPPPAHGYGAPPPPAPYGQPYQGYGQPQQPYGHQPHGHQGQGKKGGGKGGKGNKNNNNYNNNQAPVPYNNYGPPPQNGYPQAPGTGYIAPGQGGVQAPQHHQHHAHYPPAPPPPQAPGQGPPQYGQQPPPPGQGQPPPGQGQPPPPQQQQYQYAAPGQGQPGQQPDYSQYYQQQGQQQPQQYGAPQNNGNDPYGQPAQRPGPY